MAGNNIFNAFSRFRTRGMNRDGWTPRSSINEDVTGSTSSLNEEIRQLRRAVDELSVLNELSRDIGASFDTKEVMDLIIRRSVRAVSAEQAVITLVDRQQQAVDNTLVRFIDTDSERAQFHLQQALVGWMLRKQSPLLSNDPLHDNRLQCSECPKDIHSVVCVPLMAKSELIGVLSVCNKRGGDGFTYEDQRLLTIIASQSAQVIENARLFAETKQLEIMQEQVRLARQIQVELLPKSPPSLPGYDIAGLSTPAEEVGGDYYDYIPLPSDHWAIGVGDVSGKGLPASLLMANLQATLRGQLIYGGGVGRCLERANRMLHESTATEKFATLFCGILDLGTHKLNFGNAGHDYPFLFDADGRLKRLATGGVILGAFANITYEEKTVPFEPGTTLVIISDGVTDAENADGEEFGEQRLVSLLEGARHRSAQSIIATIIGAISEFVGDTPRIDDITTVVVKRDS